MSDKIRPKVDAEIETFLEGLLKQFPAVTEILRFALRRSYLAGLEAGASQWISVEDRLPDDYQAIWVTYDGGDVDEAIQHKNIVVTAEPCGVIAWMPREKPEPYKAEVVTAGR